MKKLATVLLFGGLAAALPAHAQNVSVAHILCAYTGSTTEQVFNTSISAGVAPTSCNVGSNNCAQCLADLQTNGFTQQAALNEVAVNPVSAPPQAPKPATVAPPFAAQGYVLNKVGSSLSPR